jgi:outer membrane protein assembly factor BamE (lipoprotein component of BamABCDE complex)
MKTVIKIALGILLAGAVMVGGCAALIGAAASDPEVKKSVAQLDKASDDLDDMTGENDHNYRAKVKSLELGNSKDEVVSIMGKPRDTQRMESEFGTDVSLYYGSWQLNFTDGVLDSKNRF